MAQPAALAMQTFPVMQQIVVVQQTLAVKRPAENATPLSSIAGHP